MTWEQYEVYADFDGHDELIDTTKSLKEAKQLAKKAIHEGATSARIEKETADGDYEVVKELEA